MKMHLNKYLTLITIAMSLALPACNDCSDMDMRATAPISFSIVDPDGNDLIGSAKARYKLDSIRLFDHDGTKPVVLTHVYFPGLKSYVFYADGDKNPDGKSSLRLQLNSQDSDTLDVRYVKEPSECANIYKYTEFQFNGTTPQRSPLTSALLFVKRRI